jgi:hypothetical protein
VLLLKKKAKKKGRQESNSLSGLFLQSQESDSGSKRGKQEEFVVETSLSNVSF